MSKPLTRLITSCLILLFVCSIALAQSSTATLSGTVQDENSAVIPGSKITLTNPSTGLERTATTNESGSFTIPLLPPGEYTVLVEREGFTRVQLTNIVLNVGDQKAVAVQLKVGDIKSDVIVTADASLVRTDGSVGTVVDRTFVQNIPLSGRSFQSLLELTPGVVITPVGPTGATGQFSVNGQRTTSNYFTVDGVSANTSANGGTSGGASAAGSGQMPAFTAQGTTASLVTVDALREFRIQTSSFAPEFGRTPGGQVQLVTRSGGNGYHGTLFDYVRNDKFDANDWFTNRNGQAKPPLRQNQFGGTISGPLPFFNFGDGAGDLIHSGRDRTFFFASYEGLRLLQPRSSTVTIPSRAVRNLPVNAAFKPYLDAFPIPNGPDVGVGLARFSATFSDPSSYDATAVRVDHRAGPISVFARFSHTPSFSKTRTAALSTVNTNNQKNSFFTAGATWAAPGGRIVNDLRANLTRTTGTTEREADDFGGAVPLHTFGFLGRDSATASFFFSITGGSNFSLGTFPATFKQQQLNFVDNLTMSLGSHQLKFGVDFRRNDATLLPGAGGGETLSAQIVSVQGVPTLRVSQFTVSNRDPEKQIAVFVNFSAYAQDTWQASSRLTVTYGVRWEIVPPPGAAEGRIGATLDGLDGPLTPGSVTVAPEGTPLWETRYFNLAPRFGASYRLIEKPGRELVLRGGGGVFYDLGLGSSAEGFASQWPNVAARPNLSASHPDLACRPPNVPFPLPPCALSVPSASHNSPPSFLNLMGRDIVLPRIYQWNFSAEQSLGAHQSVSVSYVGAEGRKLLRSEQITIVLGGFNPVPPPTIVSVQRNGAYSDYQSLQLQFQRRLSKGLQVLASYTLGRSRDLSSGDYQAFDDNLVLPLGATYGYSDFDVRHNFSAAATFQPSGLKGRGFFGALTRGWGVDMIFRTRSGFPVAVTDRLTVNGVQYFLRPNVVSGQPFWIEDESAPGGQRLNRAAFEPLTAIGDGDLKRGAVHGFGVRQLDMAVRREFRLAGERFRLQVRAEVFNITNTPNFANPEGTISFSTFGISDRMLGRGLGGLSALYQIGGPRSMQGSLKLIF